MKKADAIEKLTRQIKNIDNLRTQNSKSEDFQKWQRITTTEIEYIFGKDEWHVKAFMNIQFTPNNALTAHSCDIQKDSKFQEGLNKATEYFQDWIDEIKEYWKEDEAGTACSDTLDIIKLICDRFHLVAKQLTRRHNNRDTLKITDEYDVQDLFHALLTIHFDDIRPEEWTPSYAGRASRTDFLLKQEQTVIEIKKTRQGLTDKEIRDQLIIDITQYKAHPDCKKLVCFVYDPEEKIKNPRVIENDLSQITDGLDVKVFIRPK